MITPLAMMDAVDLPSGTLTFLLSDVEGSTALWEAAREAMAVALPRSLEIVETVAAAHGGVLPVEQGEGDSRLAVFHRATDALAAALAIERAFNDEAWPDGASLRVRIAVHAGDARLRDERTYGGGVVHRAARLRALARGGQILVSRAVHDLVADELPEDMELVDLGRHRLRDLSRPEEVFELRHPDLPLVEGGLRSLAAIPNNLPSAVSSFVGRVAERAQLEELLSSHRLVTVTGPGGCGKTRLTLEVAADAAADRPDGIWLVELSGVADPDLVADTVLAAVGVGEVAGLDAIDRLSEYLQSRRTLLVVDNCEHLVDSVADVLGRLADKSLVQVEETPNGDVRYWLLDTIRHFGRDRLADEGKVDDVQARHLAWVGDLCEAAEPALRRGDLATLARLDEQLDDIRVALAWACSDPARASAAVAIVGALGMYWLLRGRFREGIDWCREALAADRDGPDDAQRLRARWALAHTTSYGIDAVQAMDEAAAVATDAATAGLTVYEAHCRAIIGYGIGFEQPLDGLPLMDRAVALAYEAGDDFALIDNHQSRGYVHLFSGDVEAAAADFEAVRPIAERLGNGFHLGFDGCGRGLIASQEVGVAFTAGLGVRVLAAVERRRGDFDAAAATLDRADDLGRQVVAADLPVNVGRLGAGDTADGGCSAPGEPAQQRADRGERSPTTLAHGTKHWRTPSKKS